MLTQDVRHALLDIADLNQPQERWVALSAGLVMAINSVVAVTLGTLLPMDLKRLKLDPALVSVPLVTTMLDTIR